VEYEYHRLARSVPGYRWWTPLITALLAIAFFIVLTVVLVVIFVIIALTVPSTQKPLLNLLQTSVIDNGSPVILAASLASVAILLPSIWFARLISGPRPAGLLSSVAGRLRWKWMSRLLLPALGVYLLSTVFSLVLQPLIAGQPVPTGRVTATTLAVVLVAVLLVPLQATAEEFVFRGYLMQSVGGWLRHPLFAILIPIPFFTFGHAYDVWGMLDVSVFAIAATWLTWRTGGLEASIAAHVVNNTVIFVIGAFGLVDVNSKTGDYTEVLVSIVTLAVYSFLVLRAAKRFGLVRTRTVEPAPEPVSTDPSSEPRLSDPANRITE
jgi:membrane protease YdiL (CAAX protease family)